MDVQDVLAVAGIRPALAPDERVMLRTVPLGHDLDQYVFQDLAHAITWLSQGTEEWQAFTQADYTIAIVTLRERKHPCTNCGYRDWTIVRQRKMSVERFLAIYGQHNTEEG